MNYQKHYALLIESRLNRELKTEEYYEKHHIWPKSLGGSDDKSNLVYLTAREHFIAHWLLYKGALDKFEKHKMACAFNYICSSNNTKKKLTSRQYERARKIFSNSLKGRKLSTETKEKLRQINLGKKHTEETKRKISKSNKGLTKGIKKFTDDQKEEIRNRQLGENNNFYGKKHTEEVKETISRKMSGENNPNYGKIFSKETRKKMSDAKKGKKQKIVACPYCGKVGGEIALKQHHFDKCKFK